MYSGYQTFTHKQCGIIYRWFMGGQLVPPKDGSGRAKRPGFVYDYEGAAFRHGSLDGDDELHNCQLAALGVVIRNGLAGRYAEAQAVLDGADEAFNHDWLPTGVEPQKMWKHVI